MEEGLLRTVAVSNSCTSRAFLYVTVLLIAIPIREDLLIGFTQGVKL